jgi:hypothetical protein
MVNTLNPNLDCISLILSKNPKKKKIIFVHWIGLKISSFLSFKMVGLSNFIF